MSIDPPRRTEEDISTDPLPACKGHPWFAASYDLVTRFAERGALGELRQVIIRDAGGTVLEIGVGTGGSFPYYRNVDKLVAIEPDPYMLRRAGAKAWQLGLDVEFHQATAEMLPFPNSSFDTVVSTLVLCTVENQERALAEIRRVLKPGGDFRFIEHVRAYGAIGRVHDLVTPVWQWFGAGCHLNRRTVESIEAAGFELATVYRAQMPPVLPVVGGIAHVKKQ